MVAAPKAGARWARDDDAGRRLELVGRALAAGPNVEEIARVLVTAVLDMLDCDAAGLLLTSPYDGGGSNWVYGARRKISEDERSQLLDPLYALLAERERPPREEIRPLELSPRVLPGSGRRALQALYLTRLEGPAGCIGAALMAPRAQLANADEAHALFEALAQQASVALENARQFGRASELASRDGVTGLYNQRFFLDLLLAETSRARQQGQTMAVVMLDLDHAGGLKEVNDRLGHHAGDQLLQAVAAFLCRHVRRADVVARYGGDEFVILARQTSAPQARALAERVRERLAAEPFAVGAHVLRVTASIGVAVWEPDGGMEPSLLLEAADRALYSAKANGGNCVRTPAVSP